MEIPTTSPLDVEVSDLSSFDVGHDQRKPRAVNRARVPRRERLPRVVVGVHREGGLLEVVAALRQSRRLPRRLHRRQQETDERADDRDHRQQLDERETRS